MANRQSDPDAKEPPPLDFAALADEFGVTAHETDLISAYEAEAETELGKSASFVSDPRLGFRQISFAQIAYLEPHEYRPEVTTDDENNRYLWWETKIAPKRCPRSTVRAIRSCTPIK